MTLITQIPGRPFFAVITKQMTRRIVVKLYPNSPANSALFKAAIIINDWQIIDIYSASFNKIVAYKIIMGIPVAGLT